MYRVWRKSVTSVKGLDQSVNLMYRVWRKWHQWKAWISPWTLCTESGESQWRQWKAGISPWTLCTESGESDVNERPGSVREPYVQSLESNVNERTESVREPYVQSLEKVTSLKGLDQSANLMYRVWRKWGRPVSPWLNLMYSLEKVTSLNERPGSVSEPYVQSLEKMGLYYNMKFNCALCYISVWYETCA